VTGRSIVLKANPRRTVALRIPAEGPPVVVKRFHHPGRLARRFDRSRAEQEIELLRRLERAGVPAPRPIEARFADGAWEAATEWIEGAVPLSSLLGDPASVPVPGRALAELLARAHSAGLDHPDLHPGNLLVGADSRAWLADLRGARVRRTLGPEILLRDLVALASATRERTSARARARFLIAYLRRLPSVLRTALPARSALAADVERRARIHRREAVRRSRLRWTRLSSVCEPVEGGGFRALEPLAEGERAIDVGGVRRRDLLACWYLAARLREHGIPGARPLELRRSRATSFAVPADARPADERTVAEGLEALLAALRDRGLELEGPYRRALLADASGRLLLGPAPGVRLADADG
jgi:tRNA A-37 threonylcarbamoyl transferase component Bud32